MAQLMNLIFRAGQSNREKVSVFGVQVSERMEISGLKKKVSGVSVQGSERMEVSVFIGQRSEDR